MKLRLTAIGALLYIFAIAAPGFVHAAEPVNIDYVTFVPRMHAISKVLSADLKKIEEESGGKIKFTYRGGPETMNVPAQAAGVRKGAVDMCMVSPDFFGNMVKGMEALSISNIPVADQKKSGLYDYLNTLYNKVGLQFLYMVPKEQGNAFHFYTRKPINKISDFKGLSVSGEGIFDDIGPAFGMLPVAMQISEQYIAMKRELIDVCRGGYDSAMAFKLYEVADYIVDPGFGSAPATLFMNLNKWKSLPVGVQDYLVNSLYFLARESEKKHNVMDLGALNAAKKNGMKVIQLKGAERASFIKIIENTVYKRALKDSAENASMVYKLSHQD